MPQSNFDPDMKRQWAKKHLDELTAYAVLAGQANAPRISTEEDLKNGLYVIRIQVSHDLSVIQAALMCGDFICNLRACLDHLAWQLALFDGTPRGSKIGFPICHSNDSDARRLIAKSTKGMPPEAISIIKSFQPYHAGDAYKTSHLWRLHTLWNIDKHRHLAPHSVLPEWQFRTTALEKIATQRIDDCTIMTLPLADKHKVEFNPECTSQWTIYERDIGLDLTILDLTEMYNFVADSVLPAFSRFFPTAEVAGQSAYGSLA